MVCSESKIGYKGILYRCGRCPSCLQTRSRAWALRLAQEAKYWPICQMLTLTYSDDNLPPLGSLRRKHLQDYFKRLRQSLRRLYGQSPQGKLKYYAVGEYGDRTRRPHYHVLLFCDFDPRLFERNWGLGHINYRPLNEATINYVTNYMVKSLTNKTLRMMALLRGIEPPFKVQSQGIGLQFALDNKVRLRRDKHIKRNGKKLPLPRYYRNKLKIDFDWSEVELSEAWQEYDKHDITEHRSADYQQARQAVLDEQEKIFASAQQQKLDLLARQKIKRKK